MDKLAETLREYGNRWNPEHMAAAIREKFDVKEKSAPDPVEEMAKELYLVRVGEAADWRGEGIGTKNGWHRLARHVQGLLDAECERIAARFDPGATRPYCLYADEVARMVRALKRARP